MKVQYTIPGRICIKKNSKRVFVRRSHVTVLSSEKYLAWEKMAAKTLYMAHAGRPALTGPLEVTYVFHFKNRMAEADVTNCAEGPGDALQVAKVIENDKQIVTAHLYKKFSGEEKVEITIEQISTSATPD